MDTVVNPTLVVVGALLALGWLWAWVQWRREQRRAAALELELLRAEERLRLLDEGRVAAAEALRAEAALSARAVADQLVQRATETFQAQDRLARERLEAQLKPVAETLGRFTAQVRDMEQARSEDSGGLKAQIAALMRASQSTQDEARKLSTALRRGAGVQGRWGEETLRNVLEAAGMTPWFDFEEQASFETEGGRRRPDVIVRMPGGGVFAIDAKVSLTAFLEAQDAADDGARRAALQRHVQSLEHHVQDLASKAYWAELEGRSPDFVAMFVPGDGFLAAALDASPELLTSAMDRRVLIVTPTTLFALCKAVAYGWRVEQQALNATEVAELGRELYKRLADMGGHAAALGRALDGAVTKYNAFVGSLESRVLTQARRFEDLRVEHQAKEIPALEPVDTHVRPLSRIAARGVPGPA